MKRKTVSISFLIAVLSMVGFSGAFASGGTIYVGPSASGEGLRILSTGYTLSPLTGCDWTPQNPCGPIVVGPADLNFQWEVNRLKAAYEAGHAVGLTNATVASIRRLHDLLEHRGSAEPVPGGAQVDLVAFRKAFRDDGQLNFSSHILLPRTAAAKTPLLTKQEKLALKRVSDKGLRRKARAKLVTLHKKQQRQAQQRLRRTADTNDIQALSRIFSATGFLPPPPPGDSPQQNLINLAESYQSSAIQSDQYGNQVQVVNSVWAARSFTNSADLYYVLQETDYHVLPKIVIGGCIVFHPLNDWNNGVSSLPNEPNPTLLQPSPQTTMNTTQDISGMSFNIGGSAGWNEQQGLDASVSGGVTISNQKVTTIPPIDITNNANLMTGQTLWTYDVNDLPEEQPETIDLFSQWIWSIPFSDYQPSQTEFQFSSEAQSNLEWFDECGSNKVRETLTANLISTIPMPFGQTFALQQPVVIGLSATTVQQGTTFFINGTGLYPSLVTGVLIGGMDVPQDNITTVSDTQIEIVAPFQASNAPVVVQTTQGTSNDNFTITITN